jgi:hypothetical protein
MAELKPCPFCGGKAEYIYSMPCNGVMCTKCGVWSKTIIDTYEQQDGKAKVIEAWNNRCEDAELKFTRQFIHEHGLEFALASAWKGRAEDGK